jgi:hypothetical protein
MPYVLGGGGVMIGRGAEQHVGLTGAYQFSNFGFPKSETDEVEVAFSEKPLAAVIVFGAGADGPLGKHAGWRVDFRALSRKNTSVVEVSANSQRAIAAPGQLNAFAFFTDPAIQFSNNPGIKSSLDGFVDDLETFHGTGRVVQTSMTAGVFLRF